MHATPHFLSDRPADPASGVDVLSEVLDALHLTTAVYGRLELGTPWRLRIPAREALTFYVVARGSAWLELGDGRERTALPLSRGDAVLLPRGSAHVLRDADRSDAPPHDFDYAGCPRVRIGESERFGGAGPVTSLVTGHFTFGGATPNTLLASLPLAVHLPADAAASGPLGGVVPLIMSETTAPGPGGAVALARLADLLLIHALRHWIATAGADRCGLRAVADPAIGAALRLMHARPAEPWTVARLAAAVAMSRSAFAARFAQLVGEPPLQYLARWRMTRAARLLRDGQLSVAAVAEQVGYANPAAFTKAFARVQGVGPGAFRRRERDERPVAAGD
jgi:AraC-like DNA-binding protein